MKIIFFGTADFAVPSLEALLNAGHSIVAVVTQPDKPTGRGMQLSASPVKRAAERLGLEIWQPKRVRAESFVRRIQDLQPDLLALAAFGQIVPQSILDSPQYAPVNVHGSLLPAYRGAAPIQRAIMNGETLTGVTTMWMDATLDTGDILLKAELPILPEDNSGTLFCKLALLGAELLVETIKQFESGTIVRVPQDPALATSAPMLKPEDFAINWATESAQQICDRIRGLSPKPGAFSTIRGKRIKLWLAKVDTETTEAAPGSVLSASSVSSGLRVAAGHGTVVTLTDIQPESGKRMPADVWARGFRPKDGELFA